MALLVNHEGTYLPPQKLWYLVDGVWKEVVNVFESTVQQDIAVLDQNRIKQDKVVNALGSRATELLAKVDGSDLTIPIETDPIKIEEILKEFEIVNLQLEVAKTEQVVLTKYLFEQKAQMEYIKLVSEGEQALEKIAKNVLNPVEWQVIRIAPQSTLDERLEMAIQHGLDTNDRIFNYGLVYYRLFKVSGTDPNDDLDYLKEQFKRRLNKVAFDAGIEPTNYVLTVDSVQNVYVEVNAFVNAGAKRIEDYLASVKDQQKYILDKIEDAKVAMAALEEKVITGEIIKVDGKIQTLSSKPELVVPLGDALLKYQNVTSFPQLVSTSTLQDIAAGALAAADYPGVIKLNSDAVSLNEKLQSIQEFQTVNGGIQNDLVTGKYVFNLNVLTSKKNTLTPAKTLFWSNPLGENGVSSGTITYTQTYTSSGTYKFKNDEMVKLSTTYAAIINALLASTGNVTLGVTFFPGEQPRIISVKDGAIYAYGETSVVETKSNQVSVVNVKDLATSASNLEFNTAFNANEQPHTSIVFVKENAIVTTESSVNLAVYHPVINGLFYANTEDSGLNASTSIGTPIFEYSFNIHQLPALDYVPVNSFSFNTKEIPLTDYFKNNDNIISQILEEITPTVMNFNTFAINPSDYFKNNDNIISQDISDYNLANLVGSSFNFNVAHTLMTNAMINNDNVIQQDSSSLTEPVMVFGFNAFQTNSYATLKNGLAQETSYTAGSSINGIQIIKPTNKEIEVSLINLSATRDHYGFYMNLDYYQQTRNVITSQTGLAIIEFAYLDDSLNKVIDSIPRMVTPSSVTIYTPEYPDDLINVVKVDIPLVATMTTTGTHVPVYDQDKLNSDVDGVTNISTLSNSTIDSTGLIEGLIDSNRPDKLNKDISSIVAPAIQLNAGVTLV